MLAGAGGGEFDVGAVIGQLVDKGGAGGAILTIVAELVKKMMESKSTSH